MLFDAEPLYVPGVALLLLAAGSVAWVTLARARRRRAAHARRDARRRGRAGRASCSRSAPGRSRCRPRGSRPAAARARAAARRPARRAVRIDARFARRGRRALAPPRVVVADPLGLCDARGASPGPRRATTRSWCCRASSPSTSGGGRRRRRADRAHARQLVGAEVELDGIRPLRDGTPASRIYWPAIARGAEPQERRLRADGASQPLVALDPRGAASEEDLDAAVRAAASLAHGSRATGGCGVLLPGDRRPTELTGTLAGWPQVHARLALIGPAGTLVALERRAAARPDRLRERADARRAAAGARRRARRGARARRARHAGRAHAGVRGRGLHGYLMGARRARTLQRAPVRGSA